MMKVRDFRRNGYGPQIVNCHLLLLTNSYDMKAVTKEWSIAEKISTPVVGIEPGPPG